MAISSEQSFPESARRLAILAQEACTEWEKIDAGKKYPTDPKELKIVQVARAIGFSFAQEKPLALLGFNPILVEQVIEGAVRAKAAFHRTLAENLLGCLHLCRKMQRDLEYNAPAPQRPKKEFPFDFTAFSLLFPEYIKLRQHFEGKESPEHIMPWYISQKARDSFAQFIATGEVPPLSFEPALELISLCDMLDPTTGKPENSLMKLLAKEVSSCLETTFNSSNSEIPWAVEFLRYYSGAAVKGDNAAWNKEADLFLCSPGSDSAEKLAAMSRALALLTLSPSCIEILNHRRTISPCLLSRLLAENSYAGVAFKVISQSQPVRVVIQSLEDLALLRALLEENPTLSNRIESVIDTGKVLSERKTEITLTQNNGPLFFDMTYSFTFSRFSIMKDEKEEYTFVSKQTDDAQSFVEKFKENETGFFMSDMKNYNSLSASLSASFSPTSPAYRQLSPRERALLEERERALLEELYKARVLFEDPKTTCTWEEIRNKVLDKLP